MSDENAVSSTAVAEVAVPQEVEHLSDADYHNWRKTGDLPAKQEASPASKPVDADKTAAEKKTESGTVKKQKPDQERNWRKLESERDSFKSRAEALEKELAESKGKAEAPPSEKTAASLAAPNTGPQAPERPKRPTLAEFPNDIPAWEKAMEKYEDELLEYPAKKQAFDSAKATFDKQQALMTEKAKAINEKWTALTAKGKEIYGEEVWKKAIDDSSLPIYTNDPVERFVRDSEPETAAHLFRYFSLKRSDLERIIQLPARQQFKELEALETAMLQELGKAKPAAEPPKREVTAAKRPPAELSGRGAGAAEDEAEAALKAGDTDRYITVMNARDIAKRKTGR